MEWERKSFSQVQFDLLLAVSFIKVGMKMGPEQAKLKAFGCGVHSSIPGTRKRMMISQRETRPSKHRKIRHAEYDTRSRNRNSFAAKLSTSRINNRSLNFSIAQPMGALAAKGWISSPSTHGTSLKIRFDVSPPRYCDSDSGYMILSRGEIKLGVERSVDT